MSYKVKFRDLGENSGKNWFSGTKIVINWKNWLAKYKFLSQYAEDSYAWLTLCWP